MKVNKKEVLDWSLKKSRTKRDFYTLQFKHIHPKLRSSYEEFMYKSIELERRSVRIISIAHPAFKVFSSSKFGIYLPGGERENDDKQLYIPNDLSTLIRDALKAYRDAMQVQLIRRDNYER